MAISVLVLAWSMGLKKAKKRGSTTASYLALYDFRRVQTVELLWEGK